MNLLTLTSFTTVSITIFSIAVAGIYLNRKNILIILMCIELLLLALNLFLVTAAIHLDDALGLVFTIFIITVAASESAIGLAILVSLYNIRKTVSIQYINLLKG